MKKNAGIVWVEAGIAVVGKTTILLAKNATGQVIPVSGKLKAELVHSAEDVVIKMMIKINGIAVEQCVQ